MRRLLCALALLFAVTATNGQTSIRTPLFKFWDRVSVDKQGDIPPDLNSTIDAGLVGGRHAFIQRPGFPDSIPVPVIGMIMPRITDTLWLYYAGPVRGWDTVATREWVRLQAYGSGGTGPGPGPVDFDTLAYYVMQQNLAAFVDSFVNVACLLPKDSVGGSGSRPWKWVTRSYADLHYMPLGTTITIDGVVKLLKDNPSFTTGGNAGCNCDVTQGDIDSIGALINRYYNGTGLLLLGDTLFAVDSSRYVTRHRLDSVATALKQWVTDQHYLTEVLPGWATTVTPGPQVNSDSIVLDARYVNGVAIVGNNMIVDGVSYPIPCVCTPDGDGDPTNELELPAQGGHGGEVLYTNGTGPYWSSVPTGPDGGISSVNVTVPSFMSVGGVPINTGAGTAAITFNSQGAHRVLAGPVSGSAAPGFRSLDPSDIPPLPYVVQSAIDTLLGQAQAAGTYQPIGLYITPGDTAAMLAAYLAAINARLRTADTADMLLHYVRHSELVDTAAAIRAWVVSLGYVMAEIDPQSPHRIDSNQATPYGYVTIPFLNLHFQPALGFTPENVANKVQDFSSHNATTYPSTQAVWDLFGTATAYNFLYPHIYVAGAGPAVNIGIDTSSSTGVVPRHDLDSVAALIGAGGTPGIDDVLNVGQALSADRAVDIGGHTMEFKGSGGELKFTGFGESADDVWTTDGTGRGYWAPPAGGTTPGLQAVTDVASSTTHDITSTGTVTANLLKVGNVTISPVNATAPRTAYWPDATGVVVLSANPQVLQQKVISGTNNTISDVLYSALVSVPQTIADIAAITGTDGDFIQKVSGTWAPRSAAQVKASLALNLVENTPISTWPGSSNITQLGTIGSGIWQGTAIGATYLPTADAAGNKGISTYNPSDFGLISGIVSLGSTVVKTTGAQTLLNKTLTAPTIGDFTNAGHDHTAASKGGQITDAALSAPVGVAKGGTGVSSTTANGVMLGGTTGTGAFQNAGTGTSGQVLKSNGPGVAPTWQTDATGGGGGTSTPTINRTYRYVSTVIDFKTVAATTVFTTEDTLGRFVVLNIILISTNTTGYGGPGTFAFGWTGSFTDFGTVSISNVLTNAAWNFGANSGLAQRPTVPATTAFKVSVTAGINATTATGYIVVEGFYLKNQF